VTRKPPTSPEPCPKCGAESPCVDWNEVDVGPGVMYFDYRYRCPVHGEYAYPNEPFDHTDYFDQAKPPRAIFRDGLGDEEVEK
jgi:hypothetical protein